MPDPTVQELQEQLARVQRQLFVAETAGVQLQHDLETTKARLERERQQHEETRDRWRLTAADLGDALLRLAGAKALVETLRLRVKEHESDIVGLKSKVAHLEANAAGPRRLETAR